MVDFHTTEVIENLAAEIGKVVYIDVAKWHLYLTDAKLHTVVAQQVYPLLVENDLNEDNVTRLLSNIPVKIGGGKREVPLGDLLPLQCQVDLMDLLEEFQRQL
ncbi:DUF3181 family protein [Spirulina subsalsa FACHB-351]|uniref:DUF3181 family protein n=1 Tax=Spirulina subsalsa FACHB-351 TaxID=234711 RepID=A0ABT3KZK4_9CYAN|nr:DUF3181 family protein [Spirulina subsalsa]MCW6034676.1 DUF3181 family protein [Spirulina subsalsa FACHB-351]